MVLAKESECVSLRKELNASYSQVCQLRVDMIPFNECKLALEREARATAGLKQCLKQAKEQHEESLKGAARELEALQTELSRALARLGDLER